MGRRGRRQSGDIGKEMAGGKLRAWQLLDGGILRPEHDLEEHGSIWGGRWGNCWSPFSPRINGASAGVALGPVLSSSKYLAASKSGDVGGGFGSSRRLALLGWRLDGRRLHLPIPGTSFSSWAPRLDLCRSQQDGGGGRQHGKVVGSTLRASQPDYSIQVFRQARLFSTANQQQRQTTTKPHLYLVLDDHQNGFTIHKLDIDNDLDVSCSSEDPLNFHEPPVIHLGPPTMGKVAQFAALWQPRHLRLHCLAADLNDNERHWPWQPLSDGSQFSWSWTVSPPKFLFDPKSITAYGVHPCTGTILLSASGFESSGTFSYGSGGSGRWKRLGDWVLPFKGLAHYENVLGAWVGLHLPSLQTKDTYVLYLCVCPVMANGPPPKWKVCTKKLFMQHPYWRHVDAKLVYMGEGSKYCLMERLTYKGGGNMIYAIRLTTFTVIYGEDGELKTMPHRPARFYKAPSYLFKFDVQAFWM
ncbi:hypothetical protein BRADI_4g13802v3 [Brachypodium distachyon]|uniref:Uncharacterized protein n=1 Tax=Brachypodium distachyon TaxID=15368 RepID=A0A0Q3HHE2_BRADI|nr:hypothetical protein BRADI_4g13802v3 [Brachypodium distachyon]